LSIEFEHRRTDINDRHTCAGGGIQRALPTSARRQAKQVELIDVSAKPTQTIDGTERVAEVFVTSRFCEALIVANQLIPRAAILLVSCTVVRRFQRFRSKTIAGE